VYALAVTSDGKYLVSGGQDKNIKFWEMSSQKEVACLEGVHNCK